MRLYTHILTEKVAALAAICTLALAYSASANPSPLLGEPISIKGVTYSCATTAEDGISPDYNTTEDGTYQTAYYQSYVGVLTVRCRIGSGGNLATAEMSAGSSSLSGYLINSVYYDNVQHSDVSVTLNGHTYTSADASYAANLDSGVVNLVSTLYKGSNGQGANLSFTVTPDGVVSGDETGFYIGGSWYLNGSTSDGNFSYTSPNGRVYDSHTVNTTYSLDSSGQPVLTTTDTYRNTSNGDSFYITNGDGAINGSEAGFVINGVWDVNSVTTVNDPATVSRFGTTYFSTDSTTTVNYNSDGSYTQVNERHYSNQDGSWCTEWHQSTSVDTTDLFNCSGWDKRVGAFSYNSTSAAWDAFQAPTFAPAQLLVDGELYSFQSGQTNNGTTVTDAYWSTTNSAYCLTISGVPYDFRIGHTPVDVWLTLGGTGVFHTSGAFEVAGHTINPQYASDGSPQPGLFPETYNLWVDGVEMPFFKSFADGAGNFVDVYQNGSTGDSLKIFFSAASPDEYDVMIGQNFYANAYADGAFQISGHSITTVAPATAPSAPYGFWFGGLLYFADSTPPTSGLANYNEYTGLAGAPSLLLTYDDGNFTLSGTESITQDDPSTPDIVETTTADFSCTFAPSSGIQIMQRSGGQNSFFCEIDYTEEGSLQLRVPSIIPTDGCPPGLMMNQQLWHHAGTLISMSGQPEHYYVCDTNGGILPKLIVMSLQNASSASILYRDVNTLDGANAGTFDLATHLIHTDRPSTSPAPGSYGSLPMPAFPANPASNYQIWGALLPSQGLGLPPSFIVGGNVWRYARMDGGNAIYEGYYSGQTLTVHPTGTDGLKLVDLVDTGLGLSTEGIFNPLRQSILMRNGQLVHVFSGNELGAPTQATPNTNQLQTFPGDLDVLGDLFSFGSISTNSGLAGAVFQFSDDGTSGTLNSVLSMPNSQWLWSTATDSTAQSTQKVMKLDAGHTLNLYPASTSATPSPGVVLNPAGASSFRGPVRVLPAGDLPMDFTSGPQP